MSRAGYRPHVPAPGRSRIAGATAAEHTANRTRSGRARELLDGWAKLKGEPFRGITTDGTVRPGLFSLRPEGVPTERMAAAAAALLAGLPPDLGRRMRFAVESGVWRDWQNTELLLGNRGLRLDEAPLAAREAVMAVIGASLSARGLEKTRSVMRLNAFLGELVGGPAVLGEWSYTFRLFGEPSPDDPWGWQIFGHHLGLSCLVADRQMVLTPCFLGAEPAYADHGPHAGTSMFEDEERLGLALMRSFPSGTRERALVSRSMGAEDLPPGRWHFADHLHLGGAYRDNRVVPYEGLPGAAMTGRQRRALLDLVEAHVDPLPDGPRKAKMEDVERHLAETRFCWIGGFRENATFYYRVQGPSVFIEFDHHSGVFLTNPEPANFHVHTIVRTPNGNDYGIDLLRLHYARAAHHNGGG